MANDKHMFTFVSNDQQTLDESLYDFRNCPTPIIGLDDTDLLASIDSFDQVFDPSMNAFFGMADSPNANPFTPQAAMTLQSNSPNSPQAAIYNAATQPSTSFIHNVNPSFNFVPNTSNSFIPIQAGSSREDDNKTPLIGDTDDKNGRKEKCMSRNAVLARQNREKKKSEHNNLVKRLQELEEENASLKKKLTEYKNSNDNLRERNTYLEAIIQNLPQLVNMVEHMNSLPPNKTSSNKKS